MGWSGLERNKLDFLLTDLLPVELSELFSFSSLYSFLLGEKEQTILESTIQKLKEAKAKGNAKMFNNGWGTMPLKYSILKGNGTLREMSVIQPFSAINLFLFIECFQKEILDFFQKHHCFSLRYHKKNTDLFYKTKNKRGTEYFDKQVWRTGKAVIQQTGSYFKVAPFESINAFTSSLAWRMANFKYKYYAKIDFKACFDSIYTHSFSWIIERNVIDAKAANNSHLFITIDRVLENINGQFSNGIVVGPEFSRMMTEILLQRIDNEVMFSLDVNGLKWRKDYEVFRYVDDIFIFASEAKYVDLIIEKYAEMGEKYRLRLNELKMSKDETPYLPKEWLENTRIIADRIGDLFFKGSKEDYHTLDEDRRFIVLTDFVPVDRLKDEIAVLMKSYPDDRRSIASFLLSTLMNNISKKKDGYKLFKKDREGKAFLLIDLALFIYAFFPSFEQTRKIISILSYINNELDFINNKVLNTKLFNTIRRYEFVFETENLFDLCDWFPLLVEYNFHLDTHVEQELINTISETDDPILWANFLLYSRYNDSFFKNVLKQLESIIETRIDAIIVDKEMLQTEFWYILIFHNCPFISTSLSVKIDGVIDRIKNKAISDQIQNDYPSYAMTILLCEFLQRKGKMGKKPEESFFAWNGCKSFGEQITYRTLQRTLFKKYKKNRYGLYASVQ